MVFLDRPSELNPHVLDEPEDADMRVSGVPLARHLGHLDAIRELLDGATGYC